MHGIFDLHLTGYPKASKCFVLDAGAMYQQDAVKLDEVSGKNVTKKKEENRLFLTLTKTRLNVQKNQTTLTVPHADRSVIQNFTIAIT